MNCGSETGEIIDGAYRRLGEAAQVHSEKISVKGGGHFSLGKNGKGRLGIAGEIRDFHCRGAEVADRKRTLPEQIREVAGRQCGHGYPGSPEGIREENGQIRRVDSSQVKDTDIGKLQEKLGINEKDVNRNSSVHGKNHVQKHNQNLKHNTKTNS